MPIIRVNMNAAYRYAGGGIMAVFQLKVSMMVTALLSAIVFLPANIAVGSSSALDSGKSSQEIANEILRGARDRYVSDQQKKTERDQ